MLVHGGAAHARWWDHIAPLLAHDRRVVALDLSGHGDSGRRERYSLDGWAHEVLAVARAAGITDPPIIVGHSMGGFVALRAAGLFGADLEGIVVIDSPVQDITPEEQAAREARAFGPAARLPDAGGGDRPVPSHARSAHAAVRPGARREHLHPRRSTAAGAGSSTRPCSLAAAAR